MHESKLFDERCLSDSKLVDADSKDVQRNTAEPQSQTKSNQEKQYQYHIIIRKHFGCDDFIKRICDK